MMPQLWHQVTGYVVQITADPRGEFGLIRGQKHTAGAREELRCGQGSVQRMFMRSTLL